VNKLVDLLIVRDFESFTAACATDHEAPFDSEVFAALEAMAAEDRAAFDRLCEQLEAAGEIDVKKLRVAVDDTDDDDGDEAEVKAEPAGKKDKKKKSAKSQATLVADLAKEQSALLFHDNFGAAYACFNVGGHREIHKLRSKGFKLWLHRIYYERLHKVPSREAISAALALLEAVALFDGPKHAVAKRRATVDGKLYIDICNDQWQAYEVDRQGWRVVSNPPIFFVRSPSMQPLPLAEHGSSKRNLKRLRKLLRVRDEKDFIVLVGFLLNALGGTGPFPVVSLNGEPGSTKTTHLKVLRSFTDPNAVPVRSPPRDVRDVYVVATKSGTVAYNNLSDLPPWLSDALCVVTEGSGDSRRELYTDDDESLIFACVPAMIAGVANVITRGDLADRTLYVELTAVPESERRAEPEFWAEVEKEGPAILGALLNALVTGLKRLPTLELKTLPRMATFAKFVTACETEFWNEGDFLAAYRANADNADVDVLEGDAAVSVLRAFMDDKTDWSGTATHLLDELVTIVKRPEREAEAEHAAAVEIAVTMGTKHDADVARLAAILRQARDKARETLGKGWPKRPHFLTGCLRKVGPQLRRAGIRIEWPTAHLRARIITITNVAPHTYAESASSASSTETIIGGNGGFSNGKGGEREDAQEDAGGRSKDAGSIQPASSPNPLKSNGDQQHFEPEDAEDADSADLRGATLSRGQEAS
jgi:hypothetical protein